jgi:hypothetical protein
MRSDIKTTIVDSPKRVDAKAQLFLLDFFSAFSEVKKSSPFESALEIVTLRVSGVNV